jgi:hypothetical protein
MTRVRLALTGNAGSRLPHKSIADRWANTVEDQRYHPPSPGNLRHFLRGARLHTSAAIRRVTRAAPDRGSARHPSRVALDTDHYGTNSITLSLSLTGVAGLGALFSRERRRCPLR